MQEGEGESQRESQEERFEGEERRGGERTTKQEIDVSRYCATLPNEEAQEGADGEREQNDSALSSHPAHAAGCSKNREECARKVVARLWTKVTGRERMVLEWAAMLGCNTTVTALFDVSIHF